MVRVRRSIKQWATICRGLGSPNRLQILKILRSRGSSSVTELSEELGITLKNTSRNLSILSNLDLVQFKGRVGRVFYELNPDLNTDIKKILRIIL